MSDSHAWITLFSSSVVVIAPTIAAIYKNKSFSYSLEESIKSEVRGIRSVIFSESLEKNLFEHLNKLSNSGAMIPSLTISFNDKYNTIYYENAKHIGILPPLLAERITSFYMNVAALATDLHEKNGRFTKERVEGNMFTHKQFTDELKGVLSTFSDVKKDSEFILNYKRPNILKKYIFSC